MKTECPSFMVYSPLKEAIRGLAEAILALGVDPMDEPVRVTRRSFKNPGSVVLCLESSEFYVAAWRVPADEEEVTREWTQKILDDRRGKDWRFPDPLEKMLQAARKTRTAQARTESPKGLDKVASGRLGD